MTGFIVTGFRCGPNMFQIVPSWGVDGGRKVMNP